VICNKYRYNFLQLERDARFINHFSRLTVLKYSRHFSNIFILARFILRIGFVLLRAFMQ